MIQERISYEDIRSVKERQYGTEFQDWIWMFVKQYKDRTHFLFELLQNAEDENASEVKLSLYKDRLEIDHDGTLFSKEDVISITKVAKSTKTGSDDGKIGKFGIGFKSVYAYTSTPKIYSGDYSFEIKDFIYPYEIEAINIDKNITRIIIPFDNPEISEQKAFYEIKKALGEQIVDNTILFLNNIDSIEINIEGETHPIYISRKDKVRPDGAGFFIDAKLIYDRGSIHTEKDFIIVSDNEKDAIKLAFRVENNNIVAVPNTNIFTFFPTDKESHQSFYIHAPFETTPARDNIVEDSDYNKRLIKNICDGIDLAFGWMKDRGYLSISSINAVYPIYKYSKDTIFYQIYECAVNIIESGKEIIPTNYAKEFKRKEEIIIPESMSIVTCFSDDDIHFLFGNHNIYWIAKDISRDAYQGFRDFLKSNFNFKTYTWKDIIQKLSSRFLEMKEKSWFEKLFSSINSFCTVNANNIGSHTINVRDIPFVRLTSGEHICPYDECGTPNVYLNNPETCNRWIESDFLKSEDIKEFYAFSLKIPNYNVERIAIDTILPKYTNGNRMFSTDMLKENISDLKIIKDALIVSPMIVDRVMNSYIITDGERWLKPEDVYVPSGFDASIPEYNLIKPFTKMHFLANGYQSEPKLDVKFFTSIGCAASLRKKKMDKETYLGLTYKYLGKETRDLLRQKIFCKSYFHGLKWDVIFEGFPSTFENIDLKKSREIARFFNKSTTQFEIFGEIVGANDQNFSGACVDGIKVYSAMGIMLTFIPWMYDKNQVKVSPINIHRNELNPVYEKEAKRLLDILHFKEEDQVIEEILKRFDDPQQRETIKELLSNHDLVKEYTKAVQKAKIKEIKDQEKKNKTPQELLEEAAIKVGKVKKHDGLDEADSIPNLERRTKKLEEEFGKSMEFKVNVPHSTLKYTFHDRVSPEEKAFLESQYEGGICQICDTSIEKWNHTLHFQAINVIKTSDLSEEYMESLNTGWNSLCLCPNCAAKYQYGIKDISDFYQQVMEADIEANSREYINIHIGLQGEDNIIRYSPKHLLALKTALNYFRR